MKDLTYNRPYQYVEDLRLFACYRSKDHAVFVGQGFADNAVAFIETGPMLTKLEQQGKVVHGDFDQLITQSFDVNMPFRIYVVNPDDENGKASNAIEYTASPDIPIIDVKVDGKSVVKDQIAYIDLTGKLNVIMKPNKIYGTDSDGKETQFDRSQIEGIQHFFLNGDELPVDMGNVRAIDIAKESKTVQRVDTPLQLYGTNQNGVDATYPKDFFATSESVVNATKDIADLQTGKQDKDRSAKDGYIAIMKNGQSVGSDNSLKDTLDKLNKASSDLTSLTDKVTKGLEKDWKATAVEKRIINHPVTQSSIIITDLSLEQENKFRNVTNGVVYGRQPESLLQNGVAVGSGNSAFENASAFGNQAKATGKNSISLGAMSEGDGENSVALGAFSNAKSAKGVAIGPTSSVTGSNSVAIGADSVADADNTVSVGFDTKDPNLKSAYRRITAVDTPVDDHDAATKAYVDKNSGNGGISDYNISFEPFSNPYFAKSMGNIDKWKLRDDTLSSGENDELHASSNMFGLDQLTKEEISFPSTWSANNIGVLKIEKTRTTNIINGLESKNIRFLADDDHRLTFSLGASNVIGDDINANVKIGIRIDDTKQNSGYVDKLLFSVRPIEIKGSMKTYDIDFNLKDWIASNTNFVQPYVARLFVNVNTSFSSWKVYITGIRLRSFPKSTATPPTAPTALPDPTYAFPILPYIIDDNVNGLYSKITKIGNMAFLSVNGVFENGLITTVDGVVEPTVPLLSVDMRPAKGTNSVLVTCISETNKIFYIRLAQDGNMYATGTVEAGKRVYGSAVYLTGDYSNDGHTSNTGKSLPVAFPPSDPQYEETGSGSENPSTTTPTNTDDSNRQKSIDNSSDNTLNTSESKGDDTQTAKSASNDMATDENTVSNGEDSSDDK